MHYVYKITNLINGKFYIGESKNPDARWDKHIFCSSSKDKYECPYFHAAINKYGKENFYREILIEFDDEKIALQAEIDFIYYYNSTDRNIGYNISIGGGGVMAGRKHSPEAIEKMRQAGLGKKASEETKRKQSVSRTGLKRTPEQKQNISRSLTGRKLTTEHCKKISVRQTNRIVSEQEREKKSLHFRGEGNSSAILTEKDVIFIKKLKSEGIKRRNILKLFPQVSSDTVDGILYGTSWKYLK